jgi:hypothetical protein
VIDESTLAYSADDVEFDDRHQLVVMLSVAVYPPAITVNVT